MTQPTAVRTSDSTNTQPDNSRPNGLRLASWLTPSPNPGHHHLQGAAQ
jgi:hypothetical protein